MYSQKCFLIQREKFHNRLARTFIFFPCKNFVSMQKYFFYSCRKKKKGSIRRILATSAKKNVTYQIKIFVSDIISVEVYKNKKKKHKRK